MSIKQVLKRELSLGGSIKVKDPIQGPDTNEQAKAANTWLRWNLVFALLIFVSFSLPAWLPLIGHVNKATMEIILALLVCAQLPWIVIIINSCRCVYILRKHAAHRATHKVSPAVNSVTKPEPAYQHLVGVCLYKEPLNLLEQTLDSVAMQPNCAQCISFVVGLEQGTPDRQQKTKELMEKYENRFHRFIVTAHPSKVPGEIPGKCSNLNYAIRTAVAQLRADAKFDFDLEKTLLTTGDCDTVFPLHYFDVLQEDYQTMQPKQRHHTVWQSPLFYQINLHKSWFFVRMTGLIRSVLMMGALIPWSINSMSIFSLSLHLYIKGGCTHPGYQMEDIIALIRWMLRTKHACEIRLLPLPTLSGPTSGDGFVEELREWSRQIRRWTIGAGEVFHYFVVKSTRLPRFTAVSWACKFILYYGLMLCVAPLFSITAPIGSVQMLKWHSNICTGVLVPDEFYFNMILLGLTGLQYFWFLMVIVLNYAVNPLLPEQYRDQTGLFRNVLHWVLAWPTMLGYCLIELVAFLDLSIRGKEVCTHKAARKDALMEVKVLAPVDELHI